MRGSGAVTIPPLSKWLVGWFVRLLVCLLSWDVLMFDRVGLTDTCFVISHLWVLLCTWFYFRTGLCWFPQGFTAFGVFCIRWRFRMAVGQNLKVPF